MTSSFSLLKGLPGTGPRPVPCPRKWESLGREGTVVSFRRHDGSTWVGNFQGGLGTETCVLQHPDGRRVLVIAHGALYEVDLEQSQSVDESACCITGIWPIPARRAILFARNHIALMLWNADGLAWDTGRLSWAGFRNVRITDTEIEGEAWSAPGDSWPTFSVDLLTGNRRGGAVELPDYGTP